MSAGIKLLADTVARWDASRSLWWVMNRPDKGWASRGIPFENLAEILKSFAVTLDGEGKDEHGTFFRLKRTA